MAAFPAADGELAYAECHSQLLLRPTKALPRQDYPTATHGKRPFLLEHVFRPPFFPEYHHQGWSLSPLAPVPTYSKFTNGQLIVTQILILLVWKDLNPCPSRMLRP